MQKKHLTSIVQRFVGFARLILLFAVCNLDRSVLSVVPFDERCLSLTHLFLPSVISLLTYTSEKKKCSAVISIHTESLQKKAKSHALHCINLKEK